MTAPDPRVGEIEARLFHLGYVIEHGSSDALHAALGKDIAYLLAELADRDEKLAKVELACDAMDAGVAIRAGDPRTKSHTATVIRAVIRESRAAVAEAVRGEG